MNTDIKSKQLTIMKNYLKKIKAFGKRAIKSYWNGFVEMAALQYMPYEYKNIKNNN